jgi:hypothetical protein
VNNRECERHVDVFGTLLDCNDVNAKLTLNLDASPIGTCIKTTQNTQQTKLTLNLDASPICTYSTSDVAFNGKTVEKTSQKRNTTSNTKLTLNLDASPIGTCSTSGVAPNRCSTAVTVRDTEAPVKQTVISD